MILCCGDALIDMLPRQTAAGEAAYAPYAGGALFNTAIALGRLGAPAGFFCGLSSDMFGAQLRETLAASKVGCTYAPVSARPTTLAFVRLKDGQASYQFYDENTAARMLTVDDLPQLGAEVEAMLFGHQKGAFTGASSGGEGFFRAAEGGTILLDEIAEMPLALQAKLLRVLQEREVVPIGATQPIPVDVRVIACANRDLQTEVAEGRFRADLYYRLSVFPLATKALAERPQDIPALAATMILRHAGNRAIVPWPSAEVIDTLAAHDWPGNVRELENVIQRALLFAAGDTIEAGHIVFDRPAAPMRAANEAATLGKVVQLSEFAAIRETLKACNGSRIETARRLGISERTLRYRLAKAREQGEDIAAPHSRVASA